MGAYKKQLTAVMRLQGAASILLIALYTVLKAIQQNLQPLPDFIAGFHAGFFTSSVAVILVFMFRNLRAWKNPEVLKRRYVQYSDERNRFIRSKSGAPALMVCTFLFAAATVASGFFNETVFLTLLGVTYFTGIYAVLAKLYFRRKY